MGSSSEVCIQGCARAALTSVLGREGVPTLPLGMDSVLVSPGRSCPMPGLFTMSLSCDARNNCRRQAGQIE